MSVILIVLSKIPIIRWIIMGFYKLREQRAKTLKAEKELKDMYANEIIKKETEKVYEIFIAWVNNEKSQKNKYTFASIPIEFEMLEFICPNTSPEVRRKCWEMAQTTGIILSKNNHFYISLL